ncbi:hypothetical protein GCM10018777_56500 [Streptomyces albogriseolus]|uniref:hypothetical protein n=1 Tax=Streptomyces TaxID=1883 RepID=UPI0016797435|nr:MULTISPECIES: hypothetical protein [Streptomyces]GHB15620.1 hypothetical protein GCM10010330_81100 [Streptomyces tendae]GHG33146.1 hypothetical protein GCM10018777_56500 [Streptomyces viridodiastaticus]
MNVSRIRGIAKLLEQVKELDAANEPFEVEAEDDVPFVQLGHWVALSGVSAKALALYWMLALHLNRTRGDRYVWPTTAVLAHMLGYSRGDKIKPFVDELVAIGAIRVISVPDLKGPQKRNVYRLRRNPPEGYAGPVSLGAFYEQLSEAYEQETAGEPVYPETGVHVGPQTGGDVTPETGGHVGPRAGAVTTRTPNYMNGKDAPSARSAADGRQASTGSRGSSAGGSAASGKSKPPSYTPDQRHRYNTFVAALPAPLKALVPNGLPKPLVDAVLAATDHDSSEGRTVEQLVEFRLLPKWDKHYSRRDQAGPIEKPVGVLVAMLRRDQECQDPRCDERTNVDTGTPCISCEQRLADKRAERAQEAVQEAPAASWVPVPRDEVGKASDGRYVQCQGPTCTLKMLPTPDGLCRECREDVMV